MLKVPKQLQTFVAMIFGNQTMANDGQRWRRAQGNEKQQES